MDKWVKHLRAAPSGQSVKGVPATPEQQRIRELEKKIKRIETENEILKSDTALLMSDSLNNLR
jgi:transposase